MCTFVLTVHTIEKLTYLIVILLFIIAFGLASFIWIYSKKPKTAPKIMQQDASNSTILVLQAYERLITLSERIGFNKLTERLLSDILSANEQANVFIEAIRNEYEYNLSQQIYVSDKAWQMVTDFKEQQIFIIRQLVNVLPNNAQGADLSTAMVQFINADEQASLQSIVIETLRFEARQKF
jgi:hypothetical protein